MPVILSQPARNLCLITGALVFGCKEIPDNTNQRDVEIAYRSGGFLAAADPLELQQANTFFFQVWNNRFTLNFEDMPVLGTVPEDKKPWTGSWYPETSGGTDVNVGGGQSALKKYDQAFNENKNKASDWEREKHSSRVGWAGHCNGLAASGQRHPTEPSKSVVRGNVTFAPKEIKALMTELHMNADYQFLGGARCTKNAPTGPESRPDPTVMDACQGVNPGTLHATLANWIGMMKHVVIVDTYPGDQVWNYPVVGFKVISKNPISAQDAAKAVTGGSTYIFNPAAVKFMQLRTQIYTVSATTNEVLQNRSEGTTDLTYILELDAVGNIVGAEWTGNSIRNHPNFVWVAFDPIPSNGSRYLGNPNLDPKTVLAIYAESIGADPNNPPKDIQRPIGNNAWGEMANFSVRLDGLTTGAAFGGKPLQLKINRRGPLNVAGVELNVNLNTQALPPVTAAGTEEVSVAVNPMPGLNNLNFTWKQGGNTIQTATLAFNFDP